MTTSGKANRGFTLLEMLVVIGIISILIALLLPTLTAARRNARNAATKATMHNMKIALENYRMESGTYPINPTGTGRIFDSGVGWAPPGYYGTSGGAYDHPCMGVGAMTTGTETNEKLVTVLTSTKFLDVNKNNVVGGELKDHFNTSILIRFLVLPPSTNSEKLTEKVYIWSYGGDRRNEVNAAASYVNTGATAYDQVEAGNIENSPPKDKDDITTWR